MKIILKVEEFAQVLLGIFLFDQTTLSWWWFVALFFAPDLGMVGYLVNDKWGAFFYNILHHKGIAILIFLVGFYLDYLPFTIAGIVIFSHAAFDRVLGYGLKYNKGFKYTHLGKM